MTKPPKAYKDLAFLNSHAARTVRILCEYEQPQRRFLDEDIQSTIVLFGSARSMATEDLPPDATDIQRRLAAFYDDARELSRRLALWGARQAPQMYLCSGGGPGMMQAANRGAHDAGQRSVGLGISLPFEEGINEYVSPELAFEFHYFFMRKYWFMYLAKALILFPGGFGTMDEMFESMTLRQTRKIAKPMPTVLYGSDYWNEILNLDAMARWGTISPGDVNLFKVCNTVDEAYDYLVGQLEGDK